jgi:hypothetical protein
MTCPEFLNGLKKNCHSWSMAAASSTLDIMVYGCFLDPFLREYDWLMFWGVKYLLRMYLETWVWL